VLPYKLLGSTIALNNPSGGALLILRALQRSNGPFERVLPILGRSWSIEENKGKIFQSWKAVEFEFLVQP
jgi:hypothetical protein